MPAQRTKTNPALIARAIDASGYDIPTLAEKLSGVGVTELLIEDWIASNTTPTRGQLAKLAEVLKRQKAMFYMKSPPLESGPSVELRSASGARTRPLGPEERVQVREAMSQQTLASWLVREGPECSLPLVERLSDVDHAASLITEWLQVSRSDRGAWRNDREAFRGWKTLLEDAGVLVMQLQLGKDGLRGFSIFDRFTPLVAVNTAENASARTFTLMHETARLSAHTSASCLSATAEVDDDFERWCDRVAGEVLIPPSALANLVATRPNLVGLDLVRVVATEFRTSLRAAAVALARLDERFNSLYLLVEQTYPTADREKTPARGRGGTMRCETRLREVDVVASQVIFDAWRNREINELDARRALNLDGYELDVLDALLRARMTAVD